MPLKTIDNLCRICVQESHTFKHIYDQYILDIRLFEVINDLCQLNVYIGDGLPEYICPCCHDKLLQFYKFRQASHEGKAALLSIKMRLEKMSEGVDEASVEADVTTEHQTQVEDDWCSQRLPVESISQLLEVHIKEEPEDMANDSPEDYSLGMGRDSSLFNLEPVHGMPYERTSVVVSADGESNSCGSNEEKSSLTCSNFATNHSNPMVKARKKCRKCFVPYCKNTTSGNAEKGFVNVPLHKDRRIEWFKAARREISRMPMYELYCCGDHFNLAEDTENYMYHKTMGVRLRIKKDVLPHIFHCQSGRESEESSSSASPTSYDKGHSIFGEEMPSSSAQTQ